MAGGLIIAAPQSGTGKTVIAAGLLRLLRRRGIRVAAAKAGPDYIDAGFLAAASGAPCRNLDPWAMRAATLSGELRALEDGAELVLCEGVMGLFDGAGSAARGSTAELALATGWPVILVADLQRQAASVAALVEGFARHRAGVSIAGVIFNRVASPRHAALAAEALQRSALDIKLLGAVPRAEALGLPSRHLGLVPAGEIAEIGAFLDRAAAAIEAAIDTAALVALARPARRGNATRGAPFPPLGARIAIARDAAFAFTYETVLEAWRAAGAALSFFSPLANEAPTPACDAVFLPGGYPELFAGQLAGNRRFVDGLRDAARRGATLYGECGGYMVLGRELVDAAGTAHAMAGLLPLATSFAARKLHLGYREARLGAAGPLGAAGQAFRGHEFHYATVTAEGEGAPLFAVADVEGAALGAAGRVAGKVMGSFVHLVDRA